MIRIHNGFNAPAGLIRPVKPGAGRILEARRADLSGMNLVMRATIAIAVATALAVYILTPTVASASNDTASLTAIVETSDLAGVQEESQAGQSGDQGQVEAAQIGDQSEMQAEQTGDQGETEASQSGDQGNTQVDQSGEQG